MAPITAVTFDLWDTLVVDDSDETVRQQRGLRSKPAERRHLTWKALENIGSISSAEVDLAFGVVDAAFNNLWREHQITWPLEERFRVLLAGLGCDLNDAARRELIDAQARMEVDIAPRPMPGVHRALDELKEHYRLAVVSDAIFTPGRQLRDILRAHGLAHFFEAFAFSDEVGRSKPHRRMFAAAADALGVPLAEMAHVGDRQHNDIAGAQALGMRAILFVGSRSVDAGHTTADAVCTEYHELPHLLVDLAAKANGP